MCAQQIFALDPDGSWEATVKSQGDGSHDLVVARPDGRFFSIVGISHGGFFRPVILQKGVDGKIGDIVAELRHNPADDLWYIRTESEKVYTDPIAGIYTEHPRTKRASVSNADPVTLDGVIKTGEGNLDAQRITGDPVFSHYTIKPWDESDTVGMMPLAEYVKSPDFPGFATLFKGLLAVDDTDVAVEMFLQARGVR